MGCSTNLTVTVKYVRLYDASNLKLGSPHFAGRLGTMAIVVLRLIKFPS